MKHPRQTKRSEINAGNLKLLLARWESYKPNHPFNIIKREAMLTELRTRLAELQEGEV